MRPKVTIKRIRHCSAWSGRPPDKSQVGLVGHPSKILRRYRGNACVRDRRQSTFLRSVEYREGRGPGGLRSIAPSCEKHLQGRDHLAAKLRTEVVDHTGKQSQARHDLNSCALHLANGRRLGPAAYAAVGVDDDLDFEA